MRGMLAASRVAPTDGFRRSPPPPGWPGTSGGRRSRTSSDKSTRTRSDKMFGITISIATASVLLIVSHSGAMAGCSFSPYAFFPDRNDRVQVQVQTDAESFCDNSFREGPGYHFTSVKVATLPKHGLIATLGENHFAYHPLANYHGPDEYVIRACAIVGMRRGCSKLTYKIIVQ